MRVLLNSHERGQRRIKSPRELTIHVVLQQTFETLIKILNMSRVDEALKSWWPNERESLKSHWLLCLFDLDWYLYNALCTQNKEHCDRN